jgi:hypothetical protein
VWFSKQKLRLAFEMAFERQLSCDAWPEKPLNEPDRDHDERTPDTRFSRAPQRRYRRPPVGPDIMATLRGPGTVAQKRRPGTAGDIDRALTAIDKGFVSKAWGPLHGQAGEFM